MIFNVSPNDIILYQNQIYVTDYFMTQYIQVLLLVAICCCVGAFGVALLVHDVIVPYLRRHYGLEPLYVEVEASGSADFDNFT